MASLTDALDRLLPQTQCRRCGYDGCRPYAEAMATGSAPGNRCPPGGPSTLAALAAALGCAPLPLDPSTGSFGVPTVAVIDEALQHRQEPGDVLKMESGGGLVKDVERVPGRSAAQLGR